MTDPATLVAMLRRGEVARAGQAARVALNEQPDHPLFLTIAGLAAMDGGDPAEGARFLALAVAQRPDDLANRINLTRALIDAGDFAAAEDAVAGGPPGHPELLRLGAWAAWQRGDAATAAERYGRLVALSPGLAEDWNNLGNARDAAGDLDGAIPALRRAAALSPRDPGIVVNLARALVRARGLDEARALLQGLVERQPRDGVAWLELGLVLAADADLTAAEAAYRRALSLGERAATAELALLYDREDRLPALRELADGLDASDPQAPYVRALAARRARRFQEALALIEATPDTLDPVRRWQLIGELEDRLGSEDAAFDAFERMNRAAAEKVGDAARLAAVYRSEVARRDRSSFAGSEPWKPMALPCAERSTPAFIVGFPRSGTTLLDTCLSNLASLDVIEERPMLREVELALGDTPLASLDPASATALRKRYFDALDRIGSGDPSRRAVDKFPLHMARMALIHRLFPDAKIILAERHPCDVVLSCFFTNFEFNPAMANFLDLEAAARLYDQVWTVWERARDELPLDVHTVRYERLVEAPEEELRGAVEFLGEPWDPSVLDHRGAAARRGHIATASYAQITEPLYRRSLGRWTRYRRHLEPVLSILTPWCERLGYPAP